MVSRFGNDKEYWLESGKLLATLIMTLRGTPCIYNGSEFGMTNVAFDSIEDYRDIETLNNYQIVKDQGGDLDDFLKKVHIQGRDNVRTPVQWNTSENAGFTTGTPWIKVNPNYPTINATAAVADNHSIFHFYKKLIALRAKMPVLIYGNYEVIDNGHSEIYAYTRILEGKRVLILLNFSDTKTIFEVPIEISNKRLVIGNYDVSGDENNLVFELKAWESRIYEVF